MLSKSSFVTHILMSILSIVILKVLLLSLSGLEKSVIKSKPLDKLSCLWMHISIVMMWYKDLFRTKPNLHILIFNFSELFRDSLWHCILLKLALKMCLLCLVLQWCFRMSCLQNCDPILIKHQLNLLICLVLLFIFLRILHLMILIHITIILCCTFFYLMLLGCGVLRISEVPIDRLFFGDLKNVEKPSIWYRFVTTLKFNRPISIFWRIIDPKVTVQVRRTPHQSQIERVDQMTQQGWP